MANRKQHPNPLRRALVLLAVTAAVLAGLMFGINEIRHRAKVAHEQTKQERRQESLDAVKAGSQNALVMDSKVLPMLANDAECKRLVTGLDFASTKIDPSDANFVTSLKNLTSISFYCTGATEYALQAAKTLPITDLYFEMPDLTPESYFILKDFPNLENVRLEHVVDSEWLKRLELELPRVKIDAPFTE